MSGVEYNTMSDDNSVSSNHDDAMPNADSATAEEYDIDPGGAIKKEGAQRNVSECSELTQGYVDEGFTEKEARVKAYVNRVSLVFIYTGIDDKRLRD